MKQASCHAATRTTSRSHMSPVDSEPAAPDNVRPSERPSVPRECALKDTKTARSIWMFGGHQEHRSPDLQPLIDGATQPATWRNIRAAATIPTATRTTRHCVNSKASWQVWMIIILPFRSIPFWYVWEAHKCEMNPWPQNWPTNVSKNLGWIYHDII